MDFDSVITISGQSFADGLWRMVRPVLPQVGDRLPVSIPGLSASEVTVVRVTPQVTVAAGTPRLRVVFRLHVRGDAVVGLRATRGPAVVTVPVPVPVEARPGGGARDLEVAVECDLGVTLFGPATRQSLSVELRSPSVTGAIVDRADLRTQLDAGVQTALTVLGVTDLPLAATVTDAMAGAIKDSVEAVLPGRLAQVLTPSPLVRTGPIVFDRTALPCELGVVPFAGKAELAIAGTAPVLQLGFLSRPSRVPTGSEAFPPLPPGGAGEVRVVLDNEFVLDLLCCLVEKLPGFAFVSAAKRTEGCCTWDVVNLNLWPIGLTGRVELCITSLTGGPMKEVILRMQLGTSTGVLRIAARVELRLSVGMDGLTRLTSVGLLHDGILNVDVNVAPGAGTLAIAGAAAGTILIFPLGPAVLVFVGVVAAAVETELKRVLTTVAEGIRTLTTPPAIPAGVLDAFGSLVPATLVIDDTTVTGATTLPVTPYSAA